MFGQHPLGDVAEAIPGAFVEENRQMKRTSFMIRSQSPALCLVALAALATAPAFSQSADSGNGQLGSVSFEISCSASAQTGFEKGLILLHHMMYDQAAAVFAEASAIEPSCAMLHWGEAMTYFHPLWPGQPTPKAMEQGQRTVAEMKSADPGTQREIAFQDAVAAFYDLETDSYRARVNAWAAAQEIVYQQYPDDIDATAFQALALVSTAPRGDALMTNQRQAGALMEAVHKIAPYHPGAFHYAIHAYDNSTLAEHGLPFADGYGAISPDVPHALHMPSHIYVRAGDWDETIAWNKRSATAALAEPMGNVVSSHYAHAMDYGIYAQLQKGEFGTAETMLKDFLGLENQQGNFGSAYALSAAPGRVLLEQDLWDKAAALSVTPHSAVAWEKFPQCVANIWFAKGLGAARSGDPETVQQALLALKGIHTQLIDGKQSYWSTITEAQILTIEAWSELSQGNDELALSLMQKAADVEDPIGKSPVTPSHILPARELLGDMALQLGRKELALASFETALGFSPNRRRSLRGLQTAKDM